MKTPPQKISWLTPDYFIDCDIDIIPKLLPMYDIQWIVIIPKKNPRYQKQDFAKFENMPGLTFSYIYCKYRYRDPRYIFTYYKVFKNMIKFRSDINYVNYVPTPFFILIAMFFFKRHNTILTAHQGEVHSGFNFQVIYKFIYKISYTWFNINNLFSETQATLFKIHYPKNICFTIPLALKSFGASKNQLKNNKISFFTFGSIRPKKNIDLLIDAACLVYESGYHNFEVIIAGACDDWDFYQSKIKYPKIFQLHIRPLLNDEIPDLFSNNHYLVLPYSIVTQSGPLKIAFNYNIPVIASDLTGFKHEIVDNVNGYLFKSLDVYDLKNVLIKAIENHHSDYSQLKRKQLDYVEQTYSDKMILEKYIEMFNQVTQKNTL